MSRCLGRSGHEVLHPLLLGLSLGPRVSEIPSFAPKDLVSACSPVPKHRDGLKFPIISSITGRVEYVLYSYNCGSDVLTGSKKKKKDGLKYDKVIRLTSVNNRAFILTKWDCLAQLFP